MIPDTPRDPQAQLIDRLSDDEIFGPVEQPPPPAPSTDESLARTLRELMENPHLLEPPQVVVPHLAWAGRATLLASREGAGKSTLTAAAAAAVSCGGQFLGDTCPQGNVLWVGHEEHLGDLAARAQRFGTDPDHLYVLLRTSEPVADLIGEARRLRPALLVVDSLHALASATGALTNAGDAAQWQPLLAALIAVTRETNAALVLLHHARKGEAGGYRDSSAIGAAPDVVLELRRPSDGPTARRDLIVAKARWPLEDACLELGDAGFSLVRSATLSLDAKVLAHIGQHPGTNKAQLRAAMGSRNDETDAAVHRLIASGAVHDTGTATRHHYEVAALEPVPIPTEDDDDVPF